VNVVVWDGRIIRLHCGGCGDEVHVIPSDVTLVLGNGEHTYEFDCSNCGRRSQDAHPWVAEELRLAGATIVHPGERAADQMRDDLSDDDAVADEIHEWGMEP
jgi:hypothetical protein